jgi:hypothetical protein
VKMNFTATRVLIVLSALLTSGAAEKPTTAPADSMTGTWAFTMRVEDLTIDSVAELKQVGETISGTITTGASPQRMEIKDGKISGHDFHFTVERVADQGTFETNYSGKLAGDRISGTVVFGWITPGNAPRPSAKWTGVRVKNGRKPKPGVR